MARAAAVPVAITAALSLLAGVLLVQGLPVLPPRECLVVLLAAAVLAGWRLPRWRWLAWLPLGIAWAAWRGGAAMDARLPRALEGRDLRVVGRIVALPQRDSDGSRFTLRIERALLAGQPVGWRGKVSVAWYDDAPPLPACSRWQLLLRLTHKSEI